MAFASNQTGNYGLCQWKETDLVVHTDFNEDNQKIDTALAQKADQGDLSALANRVAAVESGKADQTALEEVDEGAARVVTSYYTGTGTYGSSNAKRLTYVTLLGRDPKLVIVRPADGEGDALVMVYGMTSTMCNLSGNYSTANKVTVTWGYKQLSWYAENPEAQMNAAGVTYRTLALA